jgi:hypothetical protein
LYGLEAIAAHNGWAQALTGAIIVMVGLTILCTVISFLPKLIALFEIKKEPSFVESTPPTTPTENIDIDMEKAANIDVLENISEAAKAYTIFMEPLGESFQLGDLYQIFKKNNLPHPHLTIKSFREAGLLCPKGNGEFSWKS